MGAGHGQSLGEYVIDDVLGEGGGGVVYAAVGPDGPVALKVTHENRELLPRDRDRYLAEAEMMRRVRHPALVPVLDAGVLPDGRPFVAMPRLKGRTLAERVAGGGRLALSQALPHFETLAEATGALHAEGLVHRDLKAENVFLEDDGGIRLLDLGIAKDQHAPHHHTTTGLVRGTPATMAPERFFGAPASEQSDVYELAVVFFVMVAGELPWAGDETDVRARAHPTALHDAVAGVPPAVGHALMAALATRPELRPRTPAALADALRAAAEGAGSKWAPTWTSQPTVTAEQLVVLEPHDTPFDAAVASHPEPSTATAWRERATRRRRLVLASVAAVALTAAAMFGARGVATPSEAQAPAEADLVPAAAVGEHAASVRSPSGPPSPSASTAAMAGGDEPDGTGVMAAPDAKADPPSAAGPVNRLGSTRPPRGSGPPTPARPGRATARPGENPKKVPSLRPAATAPRRPLDATPASQEERGAAEASPSAVPTSLPGGVHGTPPY
ncbi:MAG: protein kinase [Myxococcota bacterium]